LTIAQAFNLAFECWKTAKEKKRKAEKKKEKKETCSCEKTRKVEECSKKQRSGRNSDSPFSASNRRPSVENRFSEETNSCSHEEILLIDLSSPRNEESSTTWADVELVEENLKTDNEEDLDMCFTK